MLDQRIGFIGAGQMARAWARGLVRAELVRPEQILAADPAAGAAEQFLAEVAGAQRLADNRLVVEAAEVIVLAIKPQHMTEVTSQLSAAGVAEKLFVSIAAGVSLSVLREQLGSDRVVRVMPNTPCLVGQGAAGYALGPAASQADGELVGQLLGAVGIAFPLEESLLDAVTGLSGSGPAYIYLVIEALSDGGVRMGLPRAVATALAAQTVRGAAEMVVSTAEHPAVLKDRVASPAGTTCAGLKALEDRGLRAALIEAVESATLRSRQLGQN